MEGVRDLVPELRIEPLDDPESVSDVETRMEGLEPEVILFSDHDPDAARQINRRASPNGLLVESGELLTHEMPLVQKEPVLGWKLIHAEENAVLDRLKAAERFPHLRKNS
jgi:hypothetical protein